VAAFDAVEKAIETLGIPLYRARKLGGIRNAIEMQIEDGGDSPVVNDLLLDALCAAVVHQVGEAAAAPAIRAVETFRKSEAERWRKLQAGVPLPPVPEHQIDDAVEAGYREYQQKNVRAACDQWLAAWKIVRQLARPDLRTTTDFYMHYALGHHVLNWCQDLQLELGNVGVHDARYLERQIEFSRDFLAQFPDEGTLTHVNCWRAQGEALWELGRRGEAEAVYAALVQRFPDEAWAYIGWADHYWLWGRHPKDYPRAEAIMTRALARPNLTDRGDLLERLRDLYTESGQQDKLARLPREAAPGSAHLRPYSSHEAGISPQPVKPMPKPGRNDPCWCGSGKKYKRCHLGSDPAPT
jgi:hypothetical protein